MRVNLEKYFRKCDHAVSFSLTFNVMLLIETAVIEVLENAMHSGQYRTLPLGFQYNGYSHMRNFLF